MCSLPEPSLSQARFLKQSGGSKGGMKIGGVKEISPDIIESITGIL